MSDEQLLDEIKRAMFRREWGASDLVQAAKDSDRTLDPSTVQKMLTGERRPRRATLAKIARLLDIDPASDVTPDTSSNDVISEVADAIMRDADLIEEARLHLLNQYELLRRLPPVSQPGDIEERPLRAVAHSNNLRERRLMSKYGRKAREQFERDEAARRRKDETEDDGADG